MTIQAVRQMRLRPPKPRARELSQRCAAAARLRQCGLGDMPAAQRDRPALQKQTSVPVQLVAFQDILDSDPSDGRRSRFVPALRAYRGHTTHTGPSSPRASSGSCLRDFQTHLDQGRTKPGLDRAKWLAKAIGNFRMAKALEIGKL